MRRWFLFLFPLFSCLLFVFHVYAAVLFYDDFHELNNWGSHPDNDNPPIISLYNGKLCLNLTTISDSDNESICAVFTPQKWKDVTVTVKFAVDGYNYTGFSNPTIFAFFFYGDGEFDVEIGFQPDIRQVKIATFRDNQWVDEWVTAPLPFNDSNWHTVIIDWKGHVNVTIDGQLLVSRWIMPQAEMNFWIGAYTHSSESFSLYVDEVTISCDDSPFGSLNFQFDPSILYCLVPVLLVFAGIGVMWRFAS